MAGGILSFLFSAVLAALAWLGIGSRFRFAAVESTNHLLNMGAYALLALPFVFVVVFYLVERI